MTWQRALGIMLKRVTQVKLAEIMGGLTVKTVEKWQEYLHGKPYAWGPCAEHRVKLIALAIEAIKSRDKEHGRKPFRRLKRK